MLAPTIDARDHVRMTLSDPREVATAEPSTARPRLVVADDHKLMVRAVVRLLSPEFDVVETASDGSIALEAAERLDPDAIVLDISMPVLDGIEVARRLKATGSRTKIVFLTVHDDPDFLRVALEAGAHGYILKSRMPEDLVPAIHAALRDRIFVSPVRGRSGP
jgi:DNA-binding NarL/FixJ family response regulator